MDAIQYVDAQRRQLMFENIRADIMRVHRPALSLCGPMDVLHSLWIKYTDFRP